MKPYIQLSLAVILTFLAACGGAGSSTQSEMQSVMGDITSVLKGVQDAGTADAAKSKLEPLVERMSKLTKEMLDNPEAAATGMDVDDAKEYTQVATDYATEIGRVLGDPKLSEKLAEVLAKANQ